MEDNQIRMITSAVADWAQSAYGTQDTVVGLAEEDETDPNEAKRILVDLAIRGVGHWLVAEVWLDNGTILGVNDLGEGLPIEDIDWPWPEDELV